MYDNEPDSLALLTSHGIAIKCKFTTTGIEIVKTVSSSEISFLYCSLIHGSSWSQSVFFGGTALGEISIWQIDEADTVNIMHRVSGHNVSFFYANVYNFTDIE